MEESGAVEDDLKTSAFRSCQLPLLRESSRDVWRTNVHYAQSVNNNNNNMGAINSDGIQFLDDLGRRITQVTDDNREKAFLYQRLSVMIHTALQRGRYS